MPLIIFEHLKSRSVTAAVKRKCAQGSLADALGVSKNELEKRIVHAFRNPILPGEVLSSPIQDIVLMGDDIDPNKFPVMMCYDTGAARYTTADIVFAKDSDIGVIVSATTV